jgi:hypothetical protein
VDEAQARLEYGRIVAVELDGREVLFRPFTPLEATRVSAQMLTQPSEALELGLAACERALLSDPEAFRELADRYPLAFTGDDGALGELIRNAQLMARDRVKRGAGLWKSSDRNLGRMAENLLAFKSYTGGDYTPEQFAGAMTVAEWASSTKGVFNLFLALLKGLSKRRGR